MNANSAIVPKNATTIVVDAPNVSLVPGEEAGNLLLHFYRELGWNEKDILDPMKIRTTKEVYNRLYDQMYEHAPTR